MAPQERTSRLFNVSSTSPRGATWLLLALFATGFWTMCGTPDPAKETICTKYAAVDGSDTATGTRSEPFSSVQKLANSLAPGDTGCLQGGKYDANQEIKIAKGGTADKRVVLRSIPGERAEIRGRIWVLKDADYVTVEDLDLNSSAAKKTSDGSTLPSPTINGNNTRWINNNVTNNHTGICFLVGDSDYGTAIRTVIRNNRIHDCGRMPRTNHDHGIYLSSARGTRIVGNVIFNNADRGIQFYPDARRTLVKGNIIDGNGEGIIFSGRGRYASSNNTVRNNIISNSRERWNVESYWGQTRKVGKSNRVKNNCVWASNPRDSYYNQQGGIEPGAEGFSATRNLVAKPMYHDYEANNLKLQEHSPCSAVLDD